MNEEKLLREFIAALEALNEIYLEELGKDDDVMVNDSALDCELIVAEDITSYYVKDKIIELKKRLWSLPL